jgi:hypothetical protein|tara:strand:- start:419 stop:595 length:177 start_codon:yes stop_codon:yes gene_type:complete
MNPPDPTIEDKFVPELKADTPSLDKTATLADVIDRVNLLTKMVDQLVDDVIGHGPVEE